MKSKEFLGEIRRAEALRRAVLKKIEVEGNLVTFQLVTDLNYTAEDTAYASEVAARYVPSGFTARAKITKSLPSEEGIRRAVADILRTRFPAAAAFVLPDEIAVTLDGHGGRFVIPADENDRALLTADGALDTVHTELERMFCGSWYGEFRFLQRSKGEIETQLPPEERILAPRFFPVCRYEAIDGASPQRAIYIADLTKEASGITVCGTVSYIEERTTKTGKPYFSVTLSDGTGSLRCSYFSRKTTVEKVRAVKAGDSICLTGENEIFNGSLTFRARHLDRGAPPDGFVPEGRPARPVPMQYRAVVPSPATDLVQGMMFSDGAPLPQAALEKTFVVYDLETTGLSTTPSNGMDRIIEIGAVKITEGKIREKFSTFVACPVRLSGEIVKLTGITDEMLVGAPPISDVIADFYKFCDGAELVAHNGIMFDSKFIRYYGEQEGFIFDHRQHDTLNLAQENLRLSNYKLDTIADHFGFTFNHHRAYDDAFVTAKIFLELLRIKGSV